MKHKSHEEENIINSNTEEVSIESKDGAATMVEDSAPSNSTHTTSENQPELEIENLTIQANQLKDENLRLLAEMQNQQRRSHEEVKKSRDYAISSFAKEIITIKDYLEMALKDQSGNFDMLKMGVDLTLQQLIKVFEGHKIQEINPQKGEKLDANLHQAMNVVEEHDQESNTIVETLQKGYLLNSRVLRAAMVSVAK